MQFFCGYIIAKFNTLSKRSYKDSSHRFDCTHFNYNNKRISKRKTTEYITRVKISIYCTKVCEKFKMFSELESFHVLIAFRYFLKF